jgi:Chalcone isomerase-like
MKSCVTTLFRAAIPFMLAVSILDSVALAGELAGATLPDTLKSGDLTLKLNGLGLRKKSMFKVYVGGLYLELPTKDAGAILATDQAKAIRMHFLRDLTKVQLVEALQAGFEANAKDKTEQKAAFDRMRAHPRREGRRHADVYLPARKGHNAAGRQQGAGRLRRKVLQRGRLLNLPGTEATLRGSEKGLARPVNWTMIFPLEKTVPSSMS